MPRIGDGGGHGGQGARVSRSLDEALSDVVPSSAATAGPPGAPAEGGGLQGLFAGGEGSHGDDPFLSLVQETEILDALQKAVVDIVDRVRSGVREDLQQWLPRLAATAEQQPMRPDSTDLAASLPRRRSWEDGMAVVPPRTLGSISSLGTVQEELLRDSRPDHPGKPVSPFYVPDPPKEQGAVMPGVTRVVTPQSPSNSSAQIKETELLKRGRGFLSPEPNLHEVPRRASASSRDSKESGVSGFGNRSHCPRSYFAMHQLVGQDADEDQAKAYTTRAQISRSYSQFTLFSTYQPPVENVTSTTNTGTIRKSRLEILRHRASKIVRSAKFDYLVSFLVILSAVCIGLQTNYMSAHIGQSVPLGYRVAEWAFLFVFSLELGLRTLAHGRRLFVMSGWQWNVLDIILVSMQLIEELLSAAAHIWNLSAIRAVRVVRLIRIIRVLKVLNLVVDFRTMVNAMSSALRPFISALALVMLMVYIVGVYIMQMVIEHYYDQPGAFEANAELQTYWGSLGISTLSLCQALLGGLAWGRMVDPLAKSISFYVSPLFLAYTAFASFVMLNLINGVFFDLTFKNIRENKDRELISQVMELFIESDSNHSGKVSWEEFESQLGNPLMEKYFQVIDLDLSEARGLFTLLDVHGAGSIAAPDFVMGCLRLRGPAKALDLEQLARTVDQMYAYVQKELEMITSTIVDINVAVQSKKSKIYRHDTCDYLEGDH